VARLNLGAALENQGRHGEAIVELLEALRINPESYPAHFALGIILQRTGDLDRSNWHLQQALRFYPQSEEARQALEHGLWLINQR
jgi:Flp pilus assembly protein TadD